MKSPQLLFVVLMSMVLIISFACQKKQAESEGEVVGEPEIQSEAEESGSRLAVEDSYDTMRNGVRLILSYEKNSSNFIGVVENVSSETIKSVRVEVHLSNGTELGPTTPVDLAPGKKEIVKLSAEGQTFEWWKAHPEAGKGEHEHKGGEEHEESEENEHGEKGEKHEPEEHR